MVIAKQRLDQARQLARSNSQKLPLDTIDKQIAFNNSQISALRGAKGQELAQASASLSAQSRAPLVEQQIAQLQQQLTGLSTQYQSVSTRLLAAKAGAKAEDEQMSERLSVSEPPVVPEEPESPNRLKIIGLGTLAGFVVGAFAIFVLELITRPIRSPAALAAITGEQPLSIIPIIKPPAPPRRRWNFNPFSWRKSNLA